MISFDSNKGDAFTQSLFFKHFFKRFYLFERERDRQTDRESTQAGGAAEGATEGEGEAGSPLSREPDAGLDPTTLGS